MLKLKLQYFGHLMQTADSLEKTLMLGKIEGRRRRGHQKMRWLNGIIDAMDMNLGKLQKMVRDIVAWSAAVHRVVKSQTWLEDWKATTNIYLYIAILYKMKLLYKIKIIDFTLFTERTSNTHTHNQEAHLTSVITLVLFYFSVFPMSECFSLQYFPFLCDYPDEKQQQYSYNQSWPGSQISIFFLSVTFPSWKTRIFISLHSKKIYIVLPALQRYILFVFLGTQNTWFWQLWPMTSMWPTVTSSISSSYKPGALYSADDAWLLAQWCYSQDKANMPDFPSVIFWI